MPATSSQNPSQYVLTAYNPCAGLGAMPLLFSGPIRTFLRKPESEPSDA
jgi:hypothetical protein